MELTFNIEFNGRSYLAEVTPLVNGEEKPVNPEKCQAEEIQKIYSRQIQEMLKYHKEMLRRKHEAGDTKEYGLLVSGTSEGFQFENVLVKHGDPERWEVFVRSLFCPAETIADDKKASAKAEKRNTFAEYKKLSSLEKKQMMITVYLKKYQQLKGETVGYTPIEEQCLNCRDTAFDIVTMLRMRLHKHTECDEHRCNYNDDHHCKEKKVTKAEWAEIAQCYRAIEKAAEVRKQLLKHPKKGSL